MDLIKEDNKEVLSANAKEVRHEESDNTSITADDVMSFREFYQWAIKERVMWKLEEEKKRDSEDSAESKASNVEILPIQNTNNNLKMMETKRKVPKRRKNPTNFNQVL